MSTLNAPQGHRPPPRKRVPVILWVIVGLVGVFLVVGAIANAGSKTSTPNFSAVPTSTPLAVQPAPYVYKPDPAPAPVEITPRGPSRSVSDGTYKVGEDIIVGTYKTPGPETGAIMGCGVTRMKTDSVELNGNNIISFDYAKGPSRVTVKPGEYLKLQGGCTWTAP